MNFVRHSTRRLLVGFFLCLTIITIPSCFRKSNIREVQTLELLEKEAPVLDKDCLVVFDVDWTLIIGKDCMNRPAERKNYFKEITKDLNREKYEDFMSRMLVQQELMLVSKETPALISQLQEKGVKVIALTAATTGKFGVIEKTEDKRFKELKDQDIDFSSAFPEHEEIEFTELKKDMRGGHPRFKKGILFGMNKGELLGAFLKRVRFVPKRLIFVDDRVKHVNAIADVAKEMNIKFLGLHYTAAKSLLCRPDEAVVKLQVEAFSKTGKWLSDEKAKKRLSEEIGSKKMVLVGHPEKSYVRISPDGKKLAYLAPQNRIVKVWVKTIGADDAHPVTVDVKKGIREFVWAKNNSDILFVRDNRGDERTHVYKTNINTQKTIDLTPFDGVTARMLSLNKNFPDEILIAMNKENKRLFDVYRVSLASGKLELEAKNPGNVDFWVADTNFVVRAAVTANADGSSDLLLREGKHSQWQRKLTWRFDDSLVGSVPPRGSRPVSFSPDGKFLYLIDSADANTKRLVKMNIVTGGKEVLAFDDSYDIDTVLFGEGNNEPELVSFYRDRMQWKTLNPYLEGDLETILSLNNGELNHIQRSSDGSKWVLFFVDDTGPSSYYLYDRNTKKSNFLFYDKPVLKKYKLAPMKPIQFRSRDGLTIHGYLTCPVGRPAKNLPMVLDVHGGPWWRNRWGLTGNVHNVTAQILANQGYACLQINYRGSAGYGKKFMDAGDRELGGKMHNDLIDAVNWAIKEGVADPKKVAIMGTSMGGYAALVGATFTPDVFCCAISMSGPTNLVTMVRSIVSWRELGKAKFYKRIGHPEKDKAFLESRSPLFKVDQIKIPVLIAQGGNDPRVLPSEAEQIIGAMKAKGIEYEYLFFPDEGHGISQPQNRIKLSIVIEKFLAKHLGGRVE